MVGSREDDMAITPEDYLTGPGGDIGGLGGYTVPGVFAAAGSGDAVAVADGTGFRSWSQWDAEAAALACGFQELGVRAGDVVGVWLPNCWEFLTVHVALATIGAVQLPLHMANGAGETRALLTRTEAQALVLPAAHGGRSLLSIGARLRQDVPSLGRMFISGSEPSGADASSVVSLPALTARWLGSRPAPVRIAPDDPLLAVPSSGTTSERPKICLHTHDGLLSNAAAVAREGRAGPDDTLLSASPFTHLFGMLSIQLSLFSRGRQALLPGWDVDAFVDLARQSAASVLYAVPTQLRDLVARLPADADIRLREVRTGGAAVPGGLVADVDRVLGAPAASPSYASRFRGRDTRGRAGRGCPRSESAARTRT
jgi:acyl-CoA synthetase (AMP-forming)/AMP-acid ligase II